MKKITSTIAFKLIVPIIILPMIVISTAFVRMKLKNEELYNSKALLQSQELVTLMKNKISTISNATLLTSSMYANFSSVKWAYSVYNKTGNIDSARSIIKRNVMPIVKGVNKDVGFEQKIHFHIPPAKSLYRTWTDEYGDDLSGFRQSVLDISNIHKPIKTIELGKAGYVIRGISPIFDKQNKYLGSVETFFPFTLVFDRIIQDKNKQSYGVYISNDKINYISENINLLNNNKITNYSLLRSSDNYKNDFLEKKDFDFNNIDKTNYIIRGNCVCAISPIADYSNKIIGAIVMQVDISDGVMYIRNELIKNIVMAFIVILVLTLILYFGIRLVVITPINNLSVDIEKIAKGLLIENIENKNTGVIAKIYESFNIMLIRLHNTTDFANKIGEGNLEAELKDIDENDLLGQSLLRMRNNLLKAKKHEEANKKEEEKRAWATKGFAEFADILRNNSGNIEELATQIISNLVKYTNSNQGGLFILNDNDEDEKILELKAMYAYNRKKYAEKEIKYGEGLVGTCAIEKETIFMTEVPDDYVNITSGLGEANPNSILIVPLKLEDKVFGVIELASFNVYEDYQIKFIEKLAESIASTLSVTKTNILTQELLEQSQQQAEELAATEEEMRQNLEEMQATQEQLEETNAITKRKNNEIQAQMNAINKVALVSKTDPKGIITYVNDLFCEIAGYTREELIGKPHNIVRHPDMTKAAFKNLWDTIKAGEVWSGKVKNKKKDGGYYWVDANISPIYDENGELKEYSAIRYLITQYIDNKETVQLVHKLFPDTNTEKIEKETPVYEVELESSKKDLKNKQNDTLLVKQLKEDHKEISDILVELQRVEVTSKKGMDLLLKSKSLLLAHLEKEDKELYTELNIAAKTDENIKIMLKTFASEMEKITEFVLEFYANYSDIENIDKTKFLKDITAFIVTLKDRITKEERILYDTYNRVTTN